ncbi:hypothetical protein GJ496_005956 [Pomphorhynchus laevis]|nr:hypothetical protein GJ496_005956 [Pomphorhynchus laevis]
MVVSSPQKDDDNNNPASRTIDVFSPVKGTLKVADDRITLSSAFDSYIFDWLSRLDSRLNDIYLILDKLFYIPVDSNKVGNELFRSFATQTSNEHIMSIGDTETNNFNLSQQSIDGKTPSLVLYPPIDDSNISSSTNMDVSILANISHKHTTSNNAEYISERTNSSCVKPSNVTLNNTQNRIRCSYSGNSNNPRCFYKSNRNMTSNDTNLKYPSRKRCVLVSAAIKPYLASLFDHNERYIVSNISIVAAVRMVEQAKEVLLRRGKSKQMNFRVLIFPGRSLEERIRMRELKEEPQTRLDNGERNIRIQDFRIIHQKRKRWKNIPIITT